MSWLVDLQTHFRGRVELSPTDLLKEFSLPSGITADVLREALKVFKEEYDISTGLLRPSDSLAIFMEGPKSHNPIAWYFERSQLEDRLSAVNYHLKKGRKKWEASPPFASPTTMRDYVLAWLGIHDPPA